jgi:hypothetical protein
MLLTSQQVKDQLHIGDTRLRKLETEGVLIPVNKPKDGAKKFFRKYDSKDVTKVRVDMKASGTAPAPKPVASQTSPKSVMTLLTEMNDKLDRLIKMWM